MSDNNSLSNFWNNPGSTGSTSVSAGNTPVTNAVMNYKAVQPVQTAQINEEEPQLSMGGWILTMAILAIPLVNLVMLIIWAIRDPNPTRKTFARALLFWMLVVITVSLVLMVIFYDTFNYAPTIQKHMKVLRYAAKTILKKFGL